MSHLALAAIGALGCAGIAWLGWQAARPALDEWRTLRAIARNMSGEDRSDGR